MCHALLIMSMLTITQTKEDRTTRDQEQIQGTWQLVSGERGGKVLSEEVVKNVRLVFSANKLTTKVKARANEATFKLTPEQHPKQIDLDMDGAVGKGIYQLDGDSLKLAHGEVGEDRPKDFPVKVGSGLTVMTLKRVKP
jgi:uncharacterized protein (TIGR03067 family)